MENGSDVVILSGSIGVKEKEKTVYHWRGTYREDQELVFDRAYAIEPLHFMDGIRNAAYSVRGRKFTDLSFLKGEKLQEFEDDYEIRKHEDGTVFLFSYYSIPTFDSDDRDWDGAGHTAVYKEGGKVVILHCRHGYQIPRIEVYIGLKKSIPAFSEWLNKI